MIQKSILQLDSPSHSVFSIIFPSMYYFIPRQVLFSAGVRENARMEEGDIVLCMSVLRCGQLQSACEDENGERDGRDR